MTNIGGMQRVATELYEALGKHPEIQLSEQLLRSSWRLHHVRMPFFLGKLLVKIPRLVRERGIETVLFSSMVTAALAPYLRPRLGDRDITFAAISHGRDVTLPVTPYQWYIPAVFQALDLVLPVSEATAEACQTRGLSSSKCQVVPNGVDPARFEDTTAQAPSSFHPSEDELALCSVGRQVERKGFIWFVREVMPALPDHVHYYLAGDGPQHDIIEETARERGVDHRVHLLGKIPEQELIGLYRSSDLFIMPNIPIDGDMEGFGIVMLEAGICGLPTIASRLEGIRDVITEGKNGHLVDTEVPGAFVDQIRYYANHRDHLRQLSDRTHQFTREQFSWTAIANQYVEVLTQYEAKPTPAAVES